MRIFLTAVLFVLIFSGNVFSEEAAPPGIAALTSFIPIAIFVLIFYFLLIRPQQKSAKQHREMLQKLEMGDNVITRGGIHGKIANVRDDAVIIEIAQNVKIKVEKDAIQTRKPAE